MVSNPTYEGDNITRSHAPLKRPLILIAANTIEVSVFYSLLVVIALVAIPYGATEPWWKALFQCLIFLLAAFAVVERLLRNISTNRVGTKLRSGSTSLIFPLLALLGFAVVQILPRKSSIAGVSNVQWTLSRDPLATMNFIIQICTLMLLSWMLVTYTSDRRLYFLIDTIIAIAFLSAAFGLWRQASQAQVGFILPYLKPGFGYAQFINSNHFAFLMEMAVGLTLGVAVTRAVGGWRTAIYLAAALLMWVAVIRVNSRGGILSLLCQAVLLTVLIVFGRRREQPIENPPSARIRQLAKQVVLVLTLLIGSVVTIVFVGGDPLAGRIDNLSVEMDRKAAQTYTLRQNIWQSTWDLIKRHPIAGVGFGGYWIGITQYHRASGETTPQQAHNDYLELLASGGVIGLGIGIWFVVAFAAHARRALKTPDHFERAVVLGAIIGLLTVSIHSLVDFGLHVTVNATVCTALISMVSIVEKRRIF